MRARRALGAALGAALCIAAVPTGARAVPIEVVYDDAPGAGFLDPVRGAERRTAFEVAVAYWARTLGGDTPILIAAAMPGLGGAGDAALLAAAGAITVHRNFGVMPGTWYAAALANQLAHADLNGPNLAEIGVTFNADVDGPQVLGSVAWYYGDDARPGADIDFVTVALHEIGHGLGFLDTIDPTSGAFLLADQPSILERMLARPEIGALSDLFHSERRAAVIAPGDLVWTGPAVVGFNGGPLAVHSPEPFQSGSSVAHWDAGLPEPDLMQPFYRGPNHDPGSLLPALLDMGWTLAGEPPTPRASPAAPTPTRTPRPTATPETPRVRRELVYVSNFDDDTVSVIDPAAGGVTDTIAAGDGPLGVAASADGTRVYVAEFFTGALAVLRTGDRRFIARVAVGASPHNVAATRDGAFVAITDTAADRVAVVAADTLEVVARVPAGEQPSGLALDGDGRLAFVTNFDAATVTVVDLDARRRRAIIRAEGRGLTGVAVAPASRRGYVTALYSNFAFPLNAATLAVGFLVLPFSPVGGRAEAVVTNAAGTRAYFAGHDPNTGAGLLSVVRIADDEVLNVILAGRVPEALALSGDEARLYVANTGANTVSVIDTARFVPVRTIPVGRAPMGIAVVAVPEGQCPDGCDPPTPTATPVPARCAADCDGDGLTATSELVAAVAIALANRPLAACEAADDDGDGAVTVVDVVRGVEAALQGCAKATRN